MSVTYSSTITTGTQSFCFFPPLRQQHSLLMPGLVTLRSRTRNLEAPLSSQGFPQPRLCVFSFHTTLPMTLFALPLAVSSAFGNPTADSGITAMDGRGTIVCYEGRTVSLSAGVIRASGVRRTCRGTPLLPMKLEVRPPAPAAHHPSRTLLFFLTQTQNSRTVTEIPVRQQRHGTGTGNWHWYWHWYSLPNGHSLPSLNRGAWTCS